jgi:hypothetical protein
MLIKQLAHLHLCLSSSLPYLLKTTYGGLLKLLSLADTAAPAWDVGIIILGGVSSTGSRAATMHLAGLLVDIGASTGVRRNVLTWCLVRRCDIRFPIVATYADLDVARLILLVTVIFFAGVMPDGTVVIPAKRRMIVGFRGR